MAMRIRSASRAEQVKSARKAKAMMEERLGRKARATYKDIALVLMARRTMFKDDPSPWGEVHESALYLQHSTEYLTLLEILAENRNWAL